MYEDAPCSFIWGRGELSATPVSITERRKRSPVVGASTGHCAVVRGTRLEILLATWMDRKNKVVKKTKENLLVGCEFSKRSFLLEMHTEVFLGEMT